MWNVGCENVGCGMWDLECAMRHKNISPADATDRHRNHAGCLSTTQIAPPVRRIGTDISQAERDVENVECENVGCEMWDVGCEMWDVECGTRIFLPQMPQIDTETMQGAFIKKHGLHRCARMGLFTDSLLLLRCLPLGLSMRRRRNGLPRIFSHAE